MKKAVSQEINETIEQEINETMKQKAGETMRAIVLHQHGSVDNMRVEEVERPRPGKGEVLVKVSYSAVNPFDWKVRRAGGEVFGFALPLVLGCEASGIVVACGPEVTGFKPGDEIFGNFSFLGSYAEYAIAKAGEIGLRPGAIDLATAAGISVGALTAWRALFEGGNLQSGQRVLIHGASGGVGSLAVQLAKWKGAYVIAVASGQNEQFVRELGADEFIDYGRQDFAEIVKAADMVLDTIGGDTEARSFRVLKKGGVLVSIVNPPSQDRAAEYGVSALMAYGYPDGGILSRIIGLIEEGRLKISVGSIFDFKDFAKAHALSEAGHVRGKILLRIGL